METPPPNPQPLQRRIHLQHARIQADSTRVRRTALFTDGSTRAVTINWADVTRVAAFRRDVHTSAVQSIAVTDPANVVVLDEQMEGWPTFLAMLNDSLLPSTTFATWSAHLAPHSPDSNWTVLYPPPTD